MATVQRVRGHQKREVTMFLILFIVLLVAWVMGFLAFHIAGGLIHILLIFALISLVMHLVRRTGARV
jgi:hypothetical protein